MADAAHSSRYTRQELLIFLILFLLGVIAMACLTVIGTSDPDIMADVSWFAPRGTPPT